jgi:hypothetical protein
MKNADQREAVEGPELTGDELPPGTQLSNGTYTIVRHLKTGGFGITYLAHDTLGRKVVIKECFPGGMCARSSRLVRARSRIHAPNVTNLVEKFVVEAHSLAKVSHPNIVNVHQVFKENETAYMALDFVEGHDLLEVMGDPSLALTPAGVRSTLLKLLDAVGTVHEKGLLHRDISPDNILIDSKRNPILIDFGAAREQERSAETVASTLHIVKDGYSPQELYLPGGGDQGPWSDLYALAATFYHVISGEAPPNSQTRLAAMASNVADPCVPLAGRFDSYDAAFLAAIDKAMSVLPKGRMQSSRQWLLAITEMAGGKVVRLPATEAPRQVTPMTRVTRMEAEAARKKIGPMILIGGVAAISLVAVGVYLAMPDSNTVKVARLPADVAAESAARGETANAAPAMAPVEDVAEAEVVAKVEEPTAEAAVEKPAAEAQPVAVAAAEAEPAAVPAATEQPAATDLPALTSNWTAELPFVADKANPTTVADLKGDVPDWLVAGLQIVAVNGTPVNSIDDIPGILQQSQTPGDANAITATLSTTADGGATKVDQSIDLAVVHNVVLGSGAVFAVRFANGAWQTEVADLPTGYSGDMRVGDIVVGHVTSDTKLDTPNALKDLLEAEIAAGAATTTLAVQQNGQMWVVPFPLPK